MYFIKMKLLIAHPNIITCILKSLTNLFITLFIIKDYKKIFGILKTLSDNTGESRINKHENWPKRFLKYIFFLGSHYNPSSGYGRPQHLAPGASASCAFLELVRAMSPKVRCKFLAQIKLNSKHKLYFDSNDFLIQTQYKINVT